MVIDFHTHAFPDELAEKAISTLYECVEYKYTPVNDGTVAGLLRNMDAWGIEISVLQPVITKPTQIIRTNEWAASVRSNRIESFGGIYPQAENYKHDIDFVASLGLKGLKFHPEYQNFIVDEPHMLRVYDYALGKGLILLFHAGVDPGLPAPYKSSPRQFANIAKAMRGGVIVAAHLGGHAQWEDVRDYLAGTDVYLDTSMGFEFFPHELFLEIVKKHGADRILFASDAPWSCARSELDILAEMPLSKDEIDAIKGKNAMRLLGITEEGWK